MHHFGVYLSVEGERLLPQSLRVPDCSQPGAQVSVASQCSYAAVAILHGPDSCPAKA